MLVIIGVVTALAVIIISYYKRLYLYWKSKGIPYVEPTFPFGNFGNPLTSEVNPAIIIKNFYDEYKQKGAEHIGLYAIFTPNYVPIDLNYVKNILTKDFIHFMDRGAYCNEKDDPLSVHLLTISGVKWRNLRAKLTPTFTSGKMRMMFPTLIECSKIFNTLIDKKVDNREIIDIKEELERFATDIIGSCAFGLEINSIVQEDSPFRKYGKAIFRRSRLGALKSVFRSNFPKAARTAGIRVIPSSVSDFFMKVAKDNIEYREKSNYRRNDFMQILIDLKNRKLDHEVTEEHDGKSLTFEEIAAQCFVFFAAGFETSSTTMTFALLEMCLNPEIQEKVRKEIQIVLEKYSGELTYDAIMEMKYMNQVIDESLRKYPPVPTLLRKCVKDYKLPDNTILEKGVRCLIPVYAIHHDEEYYPNPEMFAPERFSDEEKKNRHQYAFIPFGEGPRICIGMRFGYMQSKVGLANLLKNYRFTLNEKTQVPVTLSPNSFFCTVKGGVWLHAEHL